MKQIEKTFLMHCRELIAIALLGIATEIAPAYLKPLIRSTVKTSSRIAKSKVFVENE